MEVDDLRALAETIMAIRAVDGVADLHTYGIASARKHPILTKYGATPIDDHTQDFVDVIRRAEPNGLDAVFDGMVWGYLDRGFSLLRRTEPGCNTATA